MKELTVVECFSARFGSDNCCRCRWREICREFAELREISAQFLGPDGEEGFSEDSGL